MKRSYAITLLLASLLGGCELKEKAIKFIDTAKINLNKELQITETKRFSTSCEKGDLQKELDDGWKVVKSTEEEITCSWKTERSTPGCNLERDKGCSITVPDMKGTRIDYELERSSTKELKKQKSNSEAPI